MPALTYLPNLGPLAVIGLLFAGLILFLAAMVRDLWPRAHHSRHYNAFQRTRRLAMRGSAKACVQLADMYDKGNGVRHSPGMAQHYLDMALSIYEMQARQGEPWAMLKMAEIHNRSEDGGQMSPLADRLYRRALRAHEGLAESGDVNGMAFAGYQYFHGLGCRSDLDKAARYLTGAAQKGHVPSMKTLAEYYLLGYKAKPDPVTAAKLYREAAMRGDPEAREKVGDNLIRSYGELPSREQAYYWYALAARQGRNDAERKLHALENEWSVKQLREVQDRLKAWVPS